MNSLKASVEYSFILPGNISSTFILLKDQPFSHDRSVCNGQKCSWNVRVTRRETSKKPAAQHWDEASLGRFSTWLMNSMIHQSEIFPQKFESASRWFLRWPCFKAKLPMLLLLLMDAGESATAWPAGRTTVAEWPYLHNVLLVDFKPSRITKKSVLFGWFETLVRWLLIFCYLQKLISVKYRPVRRNLVGFRP